MRENPRTLTVRGLSHYPTICASETMHALPDPADPNQAVIQNVPFFVDGLNFGDVVRLGRPDDIGIQPIEAVVIPSGHIRFLVLTGPLSITDLGDHLCEIFPTYALRTEGNGNGLLAVSVHPDLDADDVVCEVALWLEEHGVFPDNDAAGISELVVSEVGPLR